ncbi:hypothetical protein EBO15_27950 [Actinomadura harenae]|uniref:Uncharacterized protein n=1 Tax=Actinomadura harenae TaxID=2483351 RepID=A0A3M2LTA1_9ACTN|nr:hypothetical protein EBO15_27950 [Actinomadura harenae]
MGAPRDAPVGLVEDGAEVGGGEPVADACARPLGHARGGDRLVQQCGDGDGEAVRVLRRDEHSGLTREHQVLVGRHGRRDQRDPGGDRLDEHARQPLPAGRHRHRVERGQQLRDVVAVPEPAHPLGQPQPLREPFQLGGHRAAADPEPEHVPRQLGERPDEDLRALLELEPPDRADDLHAERKVQAAAGSCARA